MELGCLGGKKVVAGISQVKLSDCSHQREQLTIESKMSTGRIWRMSIGGGGRGRRMNAAGTGVVKGAWISGCWLIHEIHLESPAALDCCQKFGARTRDGNLEWKKGKDVEIRGTGI